MGSLEAVSFDMFEHQKENIQPLPEGRSAAALAKAFSFASVDLPRGVSSPARDRFEEKLKTADDLDDPLEVWLDYLKWTHETYPQGASVESGLISLLERCTTQFQSATHYANDPRYLRVWLEYAKYNDSPREIFSFLFQRGIGVELATFYEQYAHLLESLNRKNQADEVFRMGIERDARPTERLRRRYTEFIERLEANPADPNEPSSPALAVLRPALATKELTVVEREDNPQQQRSGAGMADGASSRPREKMAIFADPDGSAGVNPERSGGWESIGSIAERRKENTMESRPIEGETMKMMSRLPPSSASREKMPIFKDTSSSSTLSGGSIFQQAGPPPQPVFKVPALPTGSKNKREEKFVVDLQAIYPSEIEEELSFEELRARARGLLRRHGKAVAARPIELSADVPSATPLRSQSREPSILVDRTPVTSRTPMADRTPMASVSRTPMADRTPVAAHPEFEVREERKSLPRDDNMTIQTMPLKGMLQCRISALLSLLQVLICSLGSPDATRRRPPSPTMTVHTRAATEEIYSLFNQPLSCDTDDAVENEGVSDSSEDDDDSDEDEDEEDDDEEDEEDDEEEEEEEYSQHYNDQEDPRRRGQEVENTIDEPEVGDGARDIKEKIGIYRDSDEPSSEQSRTTTSLIPLGVPATPHQSDRPALSSKAYGFGMMTPIVETTESVATVSRSAQAKHNRFINECMDENLESSPFIEHPAPRRDILARDEAAGAEDENSMIRFSPVARKVTREVDIWRKEPVVQEMMVNPMNDGVRSAILDHATESLRSFRGLYNYDGRKLGKAEILQKAVKNKRAIENAEIVLRGTTYRLRKELGEGAFAPVYLFDVLNDENVLESEDKTSVAMKMEQPPSAWEFYIMREIERRWSGEGLSLEMRERALASMIRARELHMFADTTCLVLDYNDQGTILDLVNLVKAESIKTASGPVLGLDECLVMFFTIELFRTIEALHEVGILHGDLKPDNCMVRLVQSRHTSSMAGLSLSSTTTSKSVSGSYSAQGENGWCSKGITLIDFGRSIDITAFPRGVQFIADWKTCEQDCAEMRELRPWSYQVDYHGLASIIHMMLFGKYIETTADSSAASGRRKRYRIKESFKRYWQQDLWKQMFDILLNSALKSEEMVAEEGAEKQFPITHKLKEYRVKMEEYLEENGERSGVSLRGSLQKLEQLVMERRRHL
ncbi:Mad3/BUB1 homology region 1-domain-containing protein [Myxozyma melibiosi]|uniref:Mad3/BUB1 homology region 1-domain-containing protein n=1 Tax=Myxozyma melibiosi TaxID=54550 RepID=A0ABR1F477_9ASCO